MQDIKDSSLLKLLEESTLGKDGKFSEIANKFKGTFDSGDKADINSVLIDVCINQKTRIAYPDKEDMDAPFNKEMFELYSKTPDTPAQYIPFILFPIIGTDKQTFAVIGANSPFNHEYNFVKIMEHLTLPINLVTANLNATKDREKITKERGHQIAYMTIINMIRAMTHELRNPTTASIGYTKRLIRMAEKHPRTTLSEIKEDLSIIDEEGTKAEDAIRSFDFAIKQKLSPPGKISRTSPKLWLNLQGTYDIAQAMKRRDVA